MPKPGWRRRVTDRLCPACAGPCHHGPGTRRDGAKSWCPHSRAHRTSPRRTLTIMGWRFKGVYTVGSVNARRWLANDEVVRGSYHQIAPDDAPRARLPPDGLVVVHGFGPPTTYDREDLPRRMPWDVFLPENAEGLDEAAGALALLDIRFRPPSAMVGWMRGLARAAGAPAVLYQCEMSGGPPDHESALLVGQQAIALVQCWDEWGCRAVWPTDLKATDPLQFLLQWLGADPTGWFFEPHARGSLPGGLAWDDSVVERLSLFWACVRGDVGVVDGVLRRGADPHGYPLQSPVRLAAEHGHEAVAERLRHAGNARG